MYLLLSNQCQTNGVGNIGRKPMTPDNPINKLVGNWQTESWLIIEMSLIDRAVCILRNTGRNVELNVTVKKIVYPDKLQRNPCTALLFSILAEWHFEYCILL